MSPTHKAADKTPQKGMNNTCEDWIQMDLFCKNTTNKLLTKLLQTRHPKHSSQQVLLGMKAQCKQCSLTTFYDCEPIWLRIGRKSRNSYIRPHSIKALSRQLCFIRLLGTTNAKDTHKHTYGYTYTHNIALFSKYLRCKILQQFQLKVQDTQMLCHNTQFWFRSEYSSIYM